MPLEQTGSDWSRRRRFRERMNHGRDLAESLGVLAVAVGLMAGAASTLPGWPTATVRVTQPWRFIPAVGSQSAQYRIDVRDRPRVERVAITYRYPAYLDRPAETIAQPTADLEAPLGSEAELRIRTNIPIADAEIISPAGRHPGHIDERDDIHVRVPIVADGSLAIRLTDQHRQDASGTRRAGGASEVEDRQTGARVPAAAVFRIRALVDQPPEVKLLEPVEGSTRPAASMLDVVVEAADDHGLDAVWLEAQRSGTDASDTAEVRESAASIHTITRWDDVAGRHAAIRRHRLKLSADADAILLRAVVVDNRLIDSHGLDLQPQRSATPWRRVELMSSDDASPQERGGEPPNTLASENPSDRQRAGDLAPQSRQALERFQEKLGELLDQQRRVIEATNNLRKQRVENFTEQERRELDRMAAIEDDWARFMEEAQSDLSKLPPQDLAGSGLLEEIAEIETQLDKAADALSKNALEIADHWEHIVEENARRLEQRMESWLPESADRERFAMDEAAGEADFPLPELPETLEDLVGDLLEDEEDLFDELEDISSSAADPGTTDIGWDVLDGPITSMGAQGATGNRLPNKSEVGGRSGEGRQGKVHGEMVGDTAVGKGGRRTPTRLTPDPLSRGEIDDRSRDPVGGATGGGKRSGQGGEGIEGPVSPDRLQQDLDRLARRQAALRNRAEGIDLRIQVAGPAEVDLERLTQLMAQVEQQLRAGRYRGALAQRDLLLQRLDATHRYLLQAGRNGAERPTVRRDTTPNLPAAAQREMLGGATDPAPSGWEEIHRAYLRRLLRRSGR